MNAKKNTVAELIKRLERKAPAYLDLITAETDDEFETAFTVLLESAVNHLEKSKKHFKSLDEEGLSGALAGALSIPGLTVTQEAHVDLTIEADHCTPARTKLGEANIYSTPSYHIKGIRQLLGRYTTGHETRGIMISYVRKKDIKGITAKLKAAMDKNLPESQVGPCEDHVLRWSIWTKHRFTTSRAARIGGRSFTAYEAQTRLG
jgi:hypothetical protein